MTGGLPETPRIRRPELVPGIVFLILAGGLCAAALFRARLPAYLKPLFLEASASLLLLAGGFLSVYLIAAACARPPFTPRTIDRAGKRNLPRILENGRALLYRAAERVMRVNWRGTWLPVLVPVLLYGLALYACVRGWRQEPPPQARDPWIVGVLVLLAFPLLVLERRFANLPARTKQEALTYLLRLLLFTLLGLALAYALRWFNLPFADAVAHAVLLFNGIVAAELLLRAASYLFMPLPPLAARSHATSLAASLLRLQRPSLKAASESLVSQFGIDLSRSWALSYIRRAAFPIFVGLVVGGWFLTGVTTLGLGQRAVYEAFGYPQTVFHSGLHVYLPWPFGRLRPVEYGSVHEIPIAFPDEDEDGPPMKEKAAAETPTIEGPPPVSADRLWEASRPTEASYLVASSQNGQQNFEVLNIDLRIIYRTGLSDAAAMGAAYSLNAPEDLIRNAAGRMLARYFARYTLSSVLGQNREDFIRGFQRELQARLNQLSPSIDILGVVIETIHPPAGAAEAYQEVQAAAIEAVTKVANARGDAVRDVHQAEADATEARDGATAEAAELIAQAKVDTALFAGDVEAYRESGAAFLFERRLSVLNAAITPDTRLTIIDSRIPASQMQLLDLRPPATSQPSPSGNY